MDGKEPKRSHRHEGEPVGPLSPVDARFGQTCLELEVSHEVVGESRHDLPGAVRVPVVRHDAAEGDVVLQLCQCFS